jgi:XTP/dITP diphosphohydrolase
LRAIVVADDSGLCVDALGGEPGVYSARYAGERATDAQRNEKLLRALRGVAPDRRVARFVCAIAIIYPDGRQSVVAGTCEGFIADRPAGGNGFGYDPIFYCPEARGTLAQITPEAKHGVSHRGKAIRQMAAAIRAGADAE